MESLRFAFLTLGFLMGLVTAAEVDTVARVGVDGGIAVYLPVKRENIQRLLHRARGPKLYIPDRPVLAGHWLPDGYHLLLVDIAFGTFKDFADPNADNLNSATGAEITISIPNLAATPGGPADYSLIQGVLFDRTARGALHIPQSKFLDRYMEVDHIELRDGFVIVSDGDSARIVIAFVPRDLDHCDLSEAPTKKSSYMFTMDGHPNLDFCQIYHEPSENNQFCNTAENIFEDLLAAAPNVCIVTKSDIEKYCKTDAAIMEASGWLKNLFLFNGRRRGIAAGQYYGDYRVGAKYPCV